MSIEFSFRSLLQGRQTFYFIYLMQQANADRLVTKLISVDFRYLCRSSFHYLCVTYNEKQP